MERAKKVVMGMKTRTFLVVTFMVGCLLIIASFILPPLGVIDNSVLTASGMMFTFSGVVYGLVSDKVIRITHKDTTVYIGDKDGDKE